MGIAHAIWTGIGAQEMAVEGIAVFRELLTRAQTLDARQLATGLAGINLVFHPF